MPSLEVRGGFSGEQWEERQEEEEAGEGRWRRENSVRNRKNEIKNGFRKKRPGAFDDEKNLEVKRAF